MRSEGIDVPIRNQFLYISFITICNAFDIAPVECVCSGRSVFDRSESGVCDEGGGRGDGEERRSGQSDVSGCDGGECEHACTRGEERCRECGCLRRAAKENRAKCHIRFSFLREGRNGCLRRREEEEKRCVEREGWRERKTRPSQSGMSLPVEAELPNRSHRP